MLKYYVKLIVAILFVSNVMAQNIPSYLPKDGLVGYWPFNGNANDESGNGNHGTVNEAFLDTDRFNKKNSCYNVSISGSNIATKVLAATGVKPRTISFWFYFDKENNTNEQWVMLSYGGTTPYTQLVASIWPKNNPSVDIGASYIIYNKEVINKWHNYTLVYDNSFGNTVQNIKAYIDGVLLTDVISHTSFYQISTQNSDMFPFRVGTYNKNQTFQGKIDDLLYYNRALTDQEVKQLYEGCTKETATSSNFNSYVFTNNSSINLTASPTGGTFTGEAVANNSFNPSKAKLGKNQVKYNFKNSTGCADSTNFTMILVDTLGNKCSTYDTILKINFKLTTGIKAGQLTSMNVYPNPATDVLIIEANDIQALGGYSYKIVDLQGKEVYNALATSTKTEISLKSISAKGMYILHIVDEKGVSIENKKIVLE